MVRRNEKSSRNIVLIKIVGLYIFLQIIAHKNSESEDIDTKNLYLQIRSDKEHESQMITRERYSCYKELIKPAIDKSLSFAGLIFLLPLYVIVGIAIYLDDPGPILFTQKRVGKNRHFFELHKFRSMYMSAPHNVPTHQLENPERYITKVGQVLRKTSLDELPQIWDIFRGKMSIIGPRPALWNQKDLVIEREKYGANDIFPGLTGWAQINGRDELEIEKKAKLDGQYARKLKEGGWGAFYGDINCFFRTISSVVLHDGVIEGGTGIINR